MKFQISCLLLQPSNEAAVEFAVTDVLCKSRLWDIASLNSDSSDNVRVNQSEVALFSAMLKHSSNEKDYHLSKVHLFSEKVYHILLIFQILRYSRLMFSGQLRLKG